MKLRGAVLGFALLFLGCGAGGGETRSSEPAEGRTANAERANQSGLGRFPGHPSSPAPKKLAVEDIEPGWGAVAHRGDRILVRYIGIDYETGKVFIRRWVRKEPLAMRLGFAEISAPWERGIEGMRVGGKRRLVIPRAVELHPGAMEYLIDLVAVR
jgi:FKBP-type peptidyl-prolyl cis-trans isomerase